MKKHIVTCVKCGRQFDTNGENHRYYPESRRYECGRCVAAQKKAQKERSKEQKAAEREAKAAEREEKTGMRQSKPVMLVKIAAGVLVLACSFPLIGNGEFPAFVCGLAVSAALIAWGLIPYLKAKNSDGR